MYQIKISCQVFKVPLYELTSSSSITSQTRLTAVTCTCDRDLLFKWKFNKPRWCRGHPSPKTCMCPPGACHRLCWSSGECPQFWAPRLQVQHCRHTGTQPATLLQATRGGQAPTLPTSVPVPITLSYSEGHSTFSIRFLTSWAWFPGKQDTRKAGSPKVYGGEFVPQVSKSNYEIQNLNIVCSIGLHPGCCQAALRRGNMKLHYCLKGNLVNSEYYSTIQVRKCKCVSAFDNYDETWPNHNQFG